MSKGADPKVQDQIRQLNEKIVEQEVRHIKEVERLEKRALKWPCLRHIWSKWVAKPVDRYVAYGYSETQICLSRRCAL